MRLLRLILRLGLLNCAQSMAQQSELQRNAHIVAQRPVDCQEALFGGPLNRCPQYGTITLVETFTTTIPASTIYTERTTTFYVTSTLPGQTQTSTYLTTATTTILSTIPASTITTTQQTFVVSTQVQTATTTEPTTIVSTQISTQPQATRTATRTLTSTTFASPTVISNNCPFNQGWQYAVFTNNPTAGWYSGSTSNWGPSRMKRGGQYASRILFTGIADFIGGFSCGAGTSTTVYKRGISLPCSQYSIMHRAYFLAPSTGTYTFVANGIDDDVRFFARDLAYTGFNDSNHLRRGAWDFGGSGPGTFNVGIDLVEGEYMPMRVVFGNADGGPSFNFFINGPDGNITSGTNVVSPNVVQYGCNGTAGPPFPYAFGDEV